MPDARAPWWYNMTQSCDFGSSSLSDGSDRERRTTTAPSDCVCKKKVGTVIQLVADWLSWLSELVDVSLSAPHEWAIKSMGPVKRAEWEWNSLRFTWTFFRMKNCDPSHALLDGKLNPVGLQRNISMAKALPTQSCTTPNMKEYKDTHHYAAVWQHIIFQVEMSG